MFLQRIIPTFKHTQRYVGKKIFQHRKIHQTSSSLLSFYINHQAFQNNCNKNKMNKMNNNNDNIMKKYQHYPYQYMLIKNTPLHFSTISNSNNNHDDPRLPFGTIFANRLNDSINAYPVETVFTMLGLEIVTIYGTYNLLNYSNVEFSAEFAFAFAASRVIRKFRLPVELIVAKGMKTLLPALSTVRLLDLVSGQNLMKTIFPAKVIEEAEKEDKKEEKGFLRRTADYAYDAMNQYGLCYFLSSRLVGVVIVFSIYELVLFGFDVTSMMEYLGLDGNVGDVLGTWAGAVVLSSSFYPISIYGTSHLAPYVGKKRAERKM